ncbi:MAG: GEVED domain-containing protein [Bacteroidota bacterium]
MTKKVTGLLLMFVFSMYTWVGLAQSSVGQIDNERNITDRGEYCDAWSDPEGYESIERVVAGGVDNETINTGYADYTDMVMEIERFEPLDITVTIGQTLTSSTTVVCYIDWDQNMVFDEGYVQLFAPIFSREFSGEIIVPSNQYQGSTRIRIRVGYYPVPGEVPPPCDNDWSGEVEDYTIQILDEESLEITAGSETICQGETVNITSTVVSGSSNLSYSWTSDPAGFTSNEADISVIPDITTTYILEVNTGSNILTDQVLIDVLEAPIVSIIADDTICLYNTVVLDAGDDGVEYLWSTGETTQTVSIDPSDYGVGSHLFFVDVTGENSCVTTDSIYIEFIDCTGISELEKSLDVNIYPVPSDGVFNVSLNAMENMDLEIMVMNMTGQVVFNKMTNISGMRHLVIDIREQAKGAYQLVFKNRDQFFARRLIVK